MQKILYRFVFVLLLAGSLIPTLAVAQDASAEEAVAVTTAPVQAVPVQVDVDHASFAFETGTTLVELYLAFEAATLSYVAHEQGYLAALPVDLAIMRSTQVSLEGTPSDPVWTDQLNLSFVIADTTGLSEGQHFVHQVRAAVPPGEYELQVGIPEQLELGKPGVSMKKDMLVPDFGQNDLVYVSDVTLASSIQQSSDREDAFYKNGMVIRPNANQLFGSGLNTLFYYAEVYNLVEDISASGKYTAFTYIADANLPQPLAAYQKRAQRTLRSPDVLVGTFNVKSLPSGSYFLRIAILDDNNEAVAEQSRKFFVYNPDVERETLVVSPEESFERSQYARMTEEEMFVIRIRILPSMSFRSSFMPWFSTLTTGIPTASAKVGRRTEVARWSSLVHLLPLIHTCLTRATYRMKCGNTTISQVKDKLSSYSLMQMNSVCSN
jgi:hypothetical protein